MAGGQILAFPIDFDRRPYNTRTTVRVCDLLLENKNRDFLLKDKNRFELKEQKTFIHFYRSEASRYLYV